MVRELSKNIYLTKEANQEREDAFRACADPAEHERQITMYGEKLEAEISAIYGLSGLSRDEILTSDLGRETAAAIGPNVLLSMRDEFWAEQYADRFITNFGQPIYYTKVRDNSLSIVSASPTDGGAPMATNPLLTQAGFDTPIYVFPQRLIMTFEYDAPKLAESSASSRTKALDFARYRLRKSLQDLVITALTASFVAEFSPEQKHNLPSGRVHPTTNILDMTGSPYNGKLTLDGLRVFSDYLDTYGFSGQKVLVVSPADWNNLKTLISVTTRTDSGALLGAQFLQGGGDTLQIFDVTVVKKNNIPDKVGYGFVVADVGSPTFGIYQFGKIQTLPNMTGGSTRSKFDVVVPGIAGCVHDIIRCVKVKLA